ncbi:23S rRNA (uracil(1939)-C(5))-methyltransferase RlmD [Paenibacillus tarimensis]
MDAKPNAKHRAKHRSEASPTAKQPAQLNKQAPSSRNSAASARPAPARSAGSKAGDKRAEARQKDLRQSSVSQGQAVSRNAGDIKKRPPGGSKQTYSGRSAAPAAPASADEVKVGDKLVVTIKRLGINGEGVGYYKRKAVFINGALPDEVVKATVTAVEPKQLVARLTEIERQSPHRIAPPCPVYDTCGGCQLQHMAYEGQLLAKEEIVREAFARYARIDRDALPLRPVLGMEAPWSYRNKAQLQAGPGPGGRLALGLYEPGSRRLVDITGCAVQHPGINAAAAKVRQLADRLGVPVGTGSRGGLRTIVLRVAPHSGELQLTLVAAAEQFAHRDELVELVREQAPEITSISVNINPGTSPLVFGERTELLWGKPALGVSLGELQFDLSPRAFFQLNPEQTVKLYNSVKEASALTGKETVVDAYCGTGTIGLWLAPFAKEVRGIEVIEEAIEDARRNAELNGRENASFYVGKAEELLPRWVKQGYRPDVIVVDPPRTGCDPALLQAIVKTKPKRMVYVSCNPSTLSKDCSYLLENGFELKWVQPVDMFPQTSHVECVSLLVRKDH